VAVLLIALALTGNWYRITGTGEFTAGPPQGATIAATYDYAADGASGSFSLGRASPFLKYLAQRESNVTDDNATLAGCSDDPWLAWVSLGLEVCLVAVAGLELWCLRRRLPRADTLRAGLWITGCLLFTVALPWALTADHEPGLAVADAPAAEPAPDGSEFYHFQLVSETTYGWRGTQIHFNASGYDAALVADENVSALPDPPPAAGESVSDAYVAFAGEITARPGSGCGWWLLLAPLWLGRRWWERRVQRR